MSVYRGGGEVAGEYFSYSMTGPQVTSIGDRDLIVVDERFEEHVHGTSHSEKITRVVGKYIMDINDEEFGVVVNPIPEEEREEIREALIEDGDDSGHIEFWDG